MHNATRALSYFTSLDLGTYEIGALEQAVEGGDTYIPVQTDANGQQWADATPLEPAIIKLQAENNQLKADTNRQDQVLLQLVGHMKSLSATVAKNATSNNNNGGGGRGGRQNPGGRGGRGGKRAVQDALGEALRGLGITNLPKHLNGGDAPTEGTSGF